MTRKRLASAAITAVFSMTMAASIRAEEFPGPLTTLPPSPAPESLLAPVLQASSSLQPSTPEVQPSTAEVPSGVEPQPWTMSPIVNNSAYFGNPSYGNRFWGGGGVLLWGIKPGHTPPLVTSGTPGSLGAIGPGTSILSGGTQHSDLRVGGRFNMGYWLDPNQTRGIEGDFFFLNGPSNNFNANSDGSPGSPILARPYVNAISGLQDSQLVSFPGVLGGNVHVSSGSQFLGAQLIGIASLLSSPGPAANCCSTGCCQTGPIGYGQPGYFNQSGYRLYMIGGPVYLNLNESLVITENLTVLPPGAPPVLVPGSTIMVTDTFQTRNNFFGGQVGARGEWYRGAWFTNVSGQVAIGDTHQQVSINGTSVFTPPGGPPVAQPGGLLALPTNMGTYSRDQFSVVPQVGFNVGRQLTQNMRVYVGYTMIYWSSVVRPGDQIDPVINPTQLPTPAGPGVLVGPARPAFAFHETDFWAQGINVGVEFRR